MIRRWFNSLCGVSFPYTLPPLLLSVGAGMIRAQLFQWPPRAHFLPSLGHTRQGHDKQGERSQRTLSPCPPPPGNHRSLHPEAGASGRERHCEASGGMLESDALRREARDLCVAFSRQRGGGTLVGFGLTLPQVSLALGETVNAASSFQPQRCWASLLGLGLGSFGNGLSPEGDSEVTPWPISNLPQVSGPWWPGLLLTGWP